MVRLHVLLSYGQGDKPGNKSDRLKAFTANVRMRHCFSEQTTGLVWQQDGLE